MENLLFMCEKHDQSLVNLILEFCFGKSQLHRRHSPPPPQAIGPLSNLNWAPEQPLARGLAEGFTRYIHRMKKGLHPQMQWISYVTQSGRLINVMMSKIHREGKVYHWRARRHMAEKLSNVEKFKRRYGNTEEVEAKSGPTSKE